MAELTIGDEVDVVLNPPATGDNWHPPDTSQTGLSLITSSGGYPSGQPLSLGYLAGKVSNGCLTAKAGDNTWSVWISIHP